MLRRLKWVLSFFMLFTFLDLPIYINPFTRYDALSNLRTCGLSEYFQDIVLCYLDYNLEAPQVIWTLDGQEREFKIYIFLMFSMIFYAFIRYEQERRNPEDPEKDKKDKVQAAAINQELQRQQVNNNKLITKR